MCWQSTRQSFDIYTNTSHVYNESYHGKNNPCCILCCHTIWLFALCFLGAVFYETATGKSIKFGVKQFEFTPELVDSYTSLSRRVIVNDLIDAFPDDLEIRKDQNPKNIKVYVNNIEQDLPYCVPVPKFMQLLWLPFYVDDDSININENFYDGTNGDINPNFRAVDLFRIYILGFELSKDCLFRFDQTSRSTIIGNGMNKCSIVKLQCTIVLYIVTLFWLMKYSLNCDDMSPFFLRPLAYGVM